MQRIESIRMYRGGNMENVTAMWLCSTVKSVGQIGRVLHRFGSPERAFSAPAEAWRSTKEFSEETKAAAQKRNESMLRAMKKELDRAEAYFLWHEEERFPERLRCIPEAPFGVFVQGRLPPKDMPLIAIVGTRACTPYGEEVASYFAKELAGAGVGIVSGLAAGIDSVAQKACLSVGGYTLAVLGCGIGTPYPKENWQLYRHIRDCGGILSEYPPGTAPMKHHFPMRNRMISAFADGILVIEARKKSGTLITVDRALEQGKDVFAIPGRITDANSAGCNALVQQGARLVTSPQEILEELSYRYPVRVFHKEQEGQLSFSPFVEEEAEKKTANKCEKSMTTINFTKLPLATEEKMVYSLLRLDPKHFDRLVCESGMRPTELAQVLHCLEGEGWIRQPAPNYYVVTYHNGGNHGE